MTWGWVDWKAGIITIPREAAAESEGVKTAYSVAMNRTSRTVLERRQFIAKGDLVFPNPNRGGGIVPYDSAREAIQRAIRKAGVKPGTPHDLRHTNARMLDRAGVPATVVQSQLGHTTAATTRIYTESSAEEAAKFLENFGVGDSPTPAKEPAPSPPPS